MSSFGDTLKRDGIETDASTDRRSETAEPSKDAPSIDRATLKQWLSDGAELALLDMRDAPAYGKGGPFFAPNIPLARLAAEAALVIPVKSTRTVLVDDGDGVAESAWRILQGFGYADLRILSGGIAAWTADGVEDLPPFGVSGAVFSEAVRAAKSTPFVTAAELGRLYAKGADAIVLDTRTAEEFAIGHVPRALSVPGTELLRRFADVVPSKETLVLVSCAGLPRAIIGAQTLIDAQIPNRVAVLDNGTKGWREAGYEIEAGAGGGSAAISAAAISFAARHVELLIAGSDLPRIDFATLTAWRTDQRRTSIFLDVRTPEEFAAGPIPHSTSATGGQLFAGVYRRIAVRGARVVLIDDLAGVRAKTTAYWLRQLDVDVTLFLYDFGAGADDPIVERGALERL